MYKRNRKIVFQEKPLPLAGLGSEGSINETTTVLPTVGFVLPFSSGTTADVTTTNTGVSSNIACICSGSVFTTSYQNNQFTLPFNQGYAFVMPYTATLQSIYANIATKDIVNLSTGGERILFIAVATAPRGSNVFTVHPYSVTNIPYPTGISTPAETWLSGKKEGIGLTIEKGTKMAIVGGLTASGVTMITTLPISFNGGLFFS